MGENSNKIDIRELLKKSRMDSVWIEIIGEPVNVALNLRVPFTKELSDFLTVSLRTSG